MSGLDQLYQDIILDHHQSPRNFGRLTDAQARAEGFNPMCGDRVCVELRLSDKGIVPKFSGEGCSICMASASMMTEEVEGKSPDFAEKRIEDLRSLMLGKAEELDGDLQALSGVKRFPVRIKCALLPWTTLKEAVCKLKA